MNWTNVVEFLQKMDNQIGAAILLVFCLLGWFYLKEMQIGLTIVSIIALISKYYLIDGMIDDVGSSLAIIFIFASGVAGFIWFGLNKFRPVFRKR